MVPTVLSEHFVDLRVIGIQLMSQILPRLQFGIFHVGNIILDFIVLRMH